MKSQMKCSRVLTTPSSTECDGHEETGIQTREASWQTSFSSRGKARVHSDYFTAVQRAFSADLACTLGLLLGPTAAWPGLALSLSLPGAPMRGSGLPSIPL